MNAVAAFVISAVTAYAVMRLAFWAAGYPRRTWAAILLLVTIAVVGIVAVALNWHRAG